MNSRISWCFLSSYNIRSYKSDHFLIFQINPSWKRRRISSLYDSPDRKHLLPQVPGCPVSEDIPVAYLDPVREDDIPVPVPVRAPDPEFTGGVFRDRNSPEFQDLSPA